MDQQMLYWIMDANDMRYVDHTHTCMHACAVKFLIELPSVGLTHARPISNPLLCLSIAFRSIEKFNVFVCSLASSYLGLCHSLPAGCRYRLVHVVI